MDSSVSPKDEIWFLRACHHISKAVYLLIRADTSRFAWLSSQYLCNITLQHPGREMYLNYMRTGAWKILYYYMPEEVQCFVPEYSMEKYNCTICDISDVI